MVDLVLIFNMKKFLKEFKKSMRNKKVISAKKIITEIIHNNLISRTDHAAYISAELYKAERAIKEKITYIQDKG